MSTALLALECGDDPAAWEALGFHVDSGSVALGAVLMRLHGDGGGLQGWVLEGDGEPDLDGIPTAWAPAALPAGAASHPNGASALDHVVVFSDACDRTVDALVAAGGDLRRSGGPPQFPAPMAFVRFGPAIVEVAETPAAGRASLWGLVAVVPDVDALAASYPDLVGTPRDAVQPGRRIVTARTGDGLECALAFITPRVRTRSLDNRPDRR